MATPCASAARHAIPSEVVVLGPIARYGRRREHSPPAVASTGRPAAPLALVAPHEPARPRHAGRGVAAPPELRRDGSLPTEPGAGPAPRGAPRRAAARAQRAAHRRRLRS